MLPVIRVLAPNPGPFTLEGTNTWIVGSRPAAVIDPGPDDPAHLDTVSTEACEVCVILVTHAHPDHAPGAAALADRVRAPIRAFGSAARDVPLEDGDRIEVGGGRLTVFHTPGHTPDHVVFYSDGALFTGDLVLGRGTSVVDPPEGDLAAYLSSLRRMVDLAPRVIYPGHGPVVFDAHAKLEEYLEHRAMREAQVLAALREGAARPADLVPGIYADVPAELHPIAARQVLAHLLKLEKEERVVRTGAGRGERFALAVERRCERCGRAVERGRRLCGRCSLDALQETPTP
jgi:glyoxylase-like metal-dependent hydrolase (beta-lactamase superfamily II)